MEYLLAAQEQLARYPESSLADLYKSFFQDAFGPGHLLDDPGQARAYFDSELARMQSRGRHTSEPCGAGRNFCRIPMDLIVDGIIDTEAYYEGFLRSARSFVLPDLSRWKEEWQAIMEVLRPLSHLIREFEDDERRIEALLAKGSYESDHSDHYRRIYDPHYRIFSIEANLEMATTETIHAMRCQPSPP